MRSKAWHPWASVAGKHERVYRHAAWEESRARSPDSGSHGRQFIPREMLMHVAVSSRTMEPNQTSHSRREERTASAWHLGYDWSQTFFYGVPNGGFTPSHNLFNVTVSGPQWLTGGMVGPEASVICPLVLAVVAILFSLRHREARYQA
jgi:hypothetical protein